MVNRGRTQERCGGGLNIAGIDIGSGHPCRIIAELSNSHNGDLNAAIAMISAAKEAGADFVKIQAYTPKELVDLRGNGPAPKPWDHLTMKELYTQAQTPLEWLPTLFDEAARFGIPLFASVFGETSLAALESVNCPAYKISHFEAGNDALARLVRATGKPFIVSRGRGRFSVEFGPNVFTMHCPGGYPTAPHEMEIGNFGDDWIPWGLSSHCKDYLVAPVAVARGAKLLEYHFMLSWRPSVLESNVSLDERQFRQMVDSVRRTEELLG